jgi:DNA modification methylase
VSPERTLQREGDFGLTAARCYLRAHDPDGGTSVVRLQRIPISRLNPAPYNPRVDLKPDDPRYLAIARSIDEFGVVLPIVFNRRTGNIVAGHQRLKVLQARGERSVDAVVVSLTPTKEKALNLALNKISGDWDKEKLAEVLGDLIKTPEIDLEVSGFELPEVEQLVTDLLGVDEEEVEQFDLDAELAANRPAVTKTGDLILLGLHGEHRVLCGDATLPADLERLKGNHRVRLCHGDPPYGVALDPSARPGSKDPRAARRLAARYDLKIRNDDLSPKRYAAWFEKVVATVSEALDPGGAFYLWNSHRNFGLMHRLLESRGFKVASVITWEKESFAPSFGDYNEQTEFCLYGWKGGGRHAWYGPKNESTLWRVHRDRTANYRHPTQKALALAERAIRNSSKRGDIVFDPFLGSGTSLIAAARLGRRCFGIEIEPRYCDVIVRRYIALAGESAVTRAVAKRYRAWEVHR